MTPEQALAFVRKQGIVLESADGPVPSLAQTVVGNKIKGSWWSHPMSKDIFQVTRAVRAAPDVLVCRLIARKVTFVHERLWPALVRAAARLPVEQMSKLVEEHTASGKHLAREIPFPGWVSAGVAAQARQLGEQQALSMLEAVIPGLTEKLWVERHSRARGNPAR